MTPEQIAIANATARAAGAVGNKAITPRYVAETSVPGDLVLDFGSGPKAMHSQMLRGLGLDVVSHEFGSNVVPGVHDPRALERLYRTVMASNVLNVQSSPEMLEETLGQLLSRMEPGGRVVANFPESPRKVSLSPEDVVRLAESKGVGVKRVGGTKRAPLWEMKKLAAVLLPLLLASAFASQGREAS